MKTYNLERKTIKQSFYSKVLMPNDKGCMLWIGAKRANGYGHLGKYGKSIAAHRLSYFIHYGDTKGLNVLHKCDTPLCVAPEHLFLGTLSDNIQDCIKKGRFHTGDSRGEKNGRAKLTEQEVISIKKRMSAGVQAKELAKRYGVLPAQIYKIYNNQAWKHIKLEESNNDE